MRIIQVHGNSFCDLLDFDLLQTVFWRTTTGNYYLDSKFFQYQGFFIEIIKDHFPNMEKIIVPEPLYLRPAQPL